MSTLAGRVTWEDMCDKAYKSVAPDDEAILKVRKDMGAQLTACQASNAGEAGDRRSRIIRRPIGHFSTSLRCKKALAT